MKDPHKHLWALVDGVRNVYVCKGCGAEGHRFGMMVRRVKADEKSRKAR